MGARRTLMVTSECGGWIWNWAGTKIARVPRPHRIRARRRQATSLAWWGLEQGEDPYSRTQITQITAGFSPNDRHAEWLSRYHGASAAFFQKKQRWIQPTAGSS